MLRLKGRFYEDDFEKEFVLINDIKEGEMILDNHLLKLTFFELYRIGFVFTQEMRDNLKNIKPIWLNKKILECKNTNEIMDMLNEIMLDADKTYAFYDEKRHEYTVINGQTCWIETLVNDKFIFNEVPTLHCLYLLTSTFRAYLG